MIEWVSVALHQMSIVFHLLGNNLHLNVMMMMFTNTLNYMLILLVHGRKFAGRHIAHTRTRYCYPTRHSLYSVMLYT